MTIVWILLVFVLLSIVLVSFVFDGLAPWRLRLSRKRAHDAEFEKWLVEMDSWPDVLIEPLVFDLEKDTLNGLPFDASFAEIKRFGKPDDWFRPIPQCTHLLFCHPGFYLSLYSGMVTNVMVFLHPSDASDNFERRGSISYGSLTLLRKGECFSIDAKTTAEALLDWFGEPTSDDLDLELDERCLRFELDEHYFEFLFSLRDKALCYCGVM